MKRYAFALLIAVTGCNNPGGPTGLRETCIANAIAKMPANEHEAFYAGLAAVRAGGQPNLTDIEFARQQAALYVTAQEGDSRFATWFYGDTLGDLRACETK